jgi:hypothetical protein
VTRLGEILAEKKLVGPLFGRFFVVIERFHPKYFALEIGLWIGKFASKKVFIFQLDHKKVSVQDTNMYIFGYSVAQAGWVARFFLGTIYQNRGNIPNNHKLYQIAIQYSN